MKTKVLFASTHLHFKILGCDKTGIRSWSRCLWLQIYNWPVSFLLCILLEVPAYKALNLHMYLVISSIYIDSCCSWLLHFWYFQYQECYFNLVFIDTHFDINIYIWELRLCYWWICLGKNMDNYVLIIMAFSYIIDEFGEQIFHSLLIFFGILVVMRFKSLTSRILPNSLTTRPLLVALLLITLLHPLDSLVP